jgi:hypothetical protein
MGESQTKVLKCSAIGPAETGTGTRKLPRPKMADSLHVTSVPSLLLLPALLDSHPPRLFRANFLLSMNGHTLFRRPSTAET